MSEYKNILVPIDLSEECHQVCRQAIVVAGQFNASLHLLHVVEYVPVEPMGEALLPSVKIEDDLVQNARKRLDRLAGDLGLTSAKSRIEVGNTKAEILRIAEEEDIDLIVIGSKGRHGLNILLNLIEDTVLHAAPCDVLAVRLDTSD